MIQKVPGVVRNHLGANRTPASPAAVPLSGRSVAARRRVAVGGWRRRACVVAGEEQTSASRVLRVVGMVLEVLRKVYESVGAHRAAVAPAPRPLSRGSIAGGRRKH